MKWGTLPRLLTPSNATTVLTNPEIYLGTVNITHQSKCLLTISRDDCIRSLSATTQGKFWETTRLSTL